MKGDIDILSHRYYNTGICKMQEENKRNQDRNLKFLYEFLYIIYEMRFNHKKQRKNIMLTEEKNSF